MTFTSWRYTLTQALSFILFLVWCSVSSATNLQPPIESPIRIGATVSLEGKYKGLSYMVQNGYRLWAQEMNNNGGLLGRKVELIFYDDKSQKELVQPLYEKLITEDKVDLVLSPYGSTLTMEAARVCDKHGYVLLAATASSTAIWQQRFRYVFGVYSTADRYFLGFLDLMARHGFNSVGIIHSDATFHVSAAQGVKKWAKLFGLELVFQAQYHHPQTEMADILARMFEKDIDGLVFSGYPPAGFHFLSLLKKNGSKPPALAMSITPALPDFYSRVGVFAENIFAPSQWEADERIPFPGTRQFIDKFIELTGLDPSYQACSSYSAGQLLSRALQQTGSIDHEAIRDFVSSLDTITIMGRFKVDHTGKQIGHNPIMIQWQQGVKQIVYPGKMRTAPPLFNQAKTVEP